MVEDPLLRVLERVPFDAEEPIEAARVRGLLANPSSWVALPGAVLNVALARIHTERAYGRPGEGEGPG